MALKAIPFFFLSSSSFWLNLFKTNSCSWSLPKRVAKVMVAKFLDTTIVVTYGCHCLQKHLNTLLIKSSLGNIFPNDVRWLTISINLFCIAWILSPGFILKSSYSCVRILILAFFNSLVPSWVTCSVSYISLAILQLDTRKNSSCSKAEVVIFLALKLY